MDLDPEPNHYKSQNCIWIQQRAIEMTEPDRVDWKSETGSKSKAASSKVRQQKKCEIQNVFKKCKISSGLPKNPEFKFPTLGVLFGR